MSRGEFLHEPWRSLLSIFQAADHSSPDVLARKIERLAIEQHLKEALVQAVLGDNRPLNQWLFSQTSGRDTPIAWITPVATDEGKKHAWMIGECSELMSEVENRFIAAQKHAATDNLLLQRDIPRPLLFMRPLIVSEFDGRSSPGANEFTIFQTHETVSGAEPEDFRQCMAVNCDYLTASRRTALTRARKIITNQEILDRIDASLPLFSLIHSEGHNQGHFLGPWPYHQNKHCILAESLEEFRACLGAIRLAEHLGLSETETNDFALSVFILRFFGSGFEAFCLRQQQRDTAREISVGLMFFETLLICNAIHISGNRIVVPSVTYFRHCLVDTLKEIHDAEKSARKGGIESLRALATHWYTIAFPKQTYSPQTLMIYHEIARQLQQEKP